MGQKGIASSALRRAMAALVIATALSLVAAEPGVGLRARLLRTVPAPIEIRGQLFFKDAHTYKIWTLSATTGDIYNLPWQPNDTASGMPLPAGSMIRLTCTPAAADQPTNCTSITNGVVTASAAPVRTTGITLKLLVMVMSLTGGCTRSGVSVSAVNSAYNSANGYATFLRNCSYGTVVYESVTVISTPVQCSNAIQMCNADAMSAAARASAASQFGQSYLAAFNRFTYVLPNGISTCGWAGLAELPGTQTWYNTDSFGIWRKGTVMQESVHNLNIYHGWKDGREYYDYSTSMGYGESCPSAPELWRLGWATVADQLNSSSFPAKTFRTYTLPATCLGPDKNMIKIQPDWLGSSYNKNVYLALRARCGGDQSLLTDFNGKINIHELNANIDNNFYAVGDPRVSIIDAVGQYSTRDLTSYKIFIKTDALIDSGTRIQVKVCRYTASSSECKDPNTASPPPPPSPPPPRRSPPPSPPPPSPPPPSPPPPKKISPPPPSKKSSPPPPPTPPPPTPPPPKGGKVSPPPPKGAKKPPPRRQKSPPPPPPPPPPPFAPPPMEDNPPPESFDPPPWHDIMVAPPPASDDYTNGPPPR